MSSLAHLSRAALFGLVVSLCLAAPLAAQEVAVPLFQARVTDLTGTLSTQQRASLEERLAAFERRKGSQVVLLIVPTTGDEAIEQYSIRVAEEWKAGRKNVDDGVILLIAKDDRKLRIEVGYGLEGALPDATAKRIISEIIVPQFKAGDFYAGIDAGVDAILKVVDGEDLPPPAETSTSASDSGVDSAGAESFVVVIAMVIGAVLRFIDSNRVRLWGTGLPTIIVFITCLLAGLAFESVLLYTFMMFFVILFATFARGSGGSGGGGFRSSGGGFSGGGGGSFGGGGASGSW